MLVRYPEQNLEDIFPNEKSYHMQPEEFEIAYGLQPNYVWIWIVNAFDLNLKLIEFFLSKKSPRNSMRLIMHGLFESNTPLLLADQLSPQ